MIKLFHCGDFHLNSPFSYLSADPRKSEERQTGLCRVFDAALKRAADEGCAAVLMTGDIFDRSYITPDTISVICRSISEFKAPVIAAPGNHDPFSTGSFWTNTKLPDNLFVFSSEELSSFDFPELGLTVWGYAFTSDRLDTSPLAGKGSLKRQNRVGVLCAHADITSPISKYAPITPRELADSQLEYAALGHIHNPPTPERFENTLTAYSGFPEGRGFDETGRGGALIVTIDDGEITLKPARISEHITVSAGVDISGSETDEHTAKLICRKLDEVKAAAGVESETKASVRLILEGEIPPDYIPGKEKIASLLSELGFFYLEISDNTLPTLGGDKLADDLTLKGELYRTLLPKMQNGNSQEREIAIAALRIGLRALEGKAILQI